MNRIFSPLKSKMKSPAVGDLLDGLQSLEDKGFIKLRGDRKKIAEARALERSTETYGSITVRLVKAFQGWQGMEMTGEVDEVTAKAINEELEKYGVVKPEKPEDDKHDDESGKDDEKDKLPVEDPLLVHGVVSRAEGGPLAGVLVRAYEKDLNTAYNPLGKEAITGADGQYSIPFITKDLKFGGLDIFIRVYKGDALLGESPVKRYAGKQINIDVRVKPQPQPVDIQKLLFVFDPSVLFGSLSDLSGFSKQQADLISQRINQALQNEIFAAIGVVSDEFRRVVLAATAQLDYSQVKDAVLTTVIKDNVLKEVAQNTSLIQEVAEVEARLANQPATKVGAVLQLDVPVKANPIFADELPRIRTLEYARLAKLDSTVTDKLLAKNLRLDEADPTTLSALVQEGVINTTQKAELQLTVDLARLTGDNMAIVGALKTKAVNAVVDLIAMDKSAWEHLITSNKLPLPHGESVESYTDTILFNLERTYPSQILLDRVVKSTQTAPVHLLDNLHILLQDNAQLIDGVKPAPIDWKAVAESKRDQLKKDLLSLTALANTYRHLGMVTLINDKNLSLEQKKNAIGSRLHLLSVFYQNNPNLDLRFTNLAEGQKDNLNWSNIPAADQPLVKKQLMSYKRMLFITDDSTDRQILLSKGFDSFMVISGMPEATFLGMSGLDQGKARMIYDKVLEIVSSGAHAIEAIRDVVSGQFKGMHVGNLDPELINDLRGVEGLADLFGSQDYCDCAECRSVLSPAAYFADLMRFIDQHVSEPVFVTSGHTKDSLYLKIRRPDLWAVQLSCENTDTLIPYLTIVNEVLETVLEKRLGGKNIFEQLTKENISFHLPFNLPWAETQLYLGHFSLTLFDLYYALGKPYDEHGKPDKNIWRARLDLSPEEFTTITQEDLGNIRHRFDDPASLADFPVADTKDRRGFINYLGIRREQLTELLASRLNPDLQNITISQQTSPDELQNFPEIVIGLTDVRLDFIHRFIRLWRKTPWSIPELDLVLVALKNARLIESDFQENEGAPILYLAQLVDLQNSLKLSVEELCVLVDQLPVSAAYPNSPKNPADKRLFERLFGVDHLNIPVLLAGLAISETELLQLFKFLSIEINPDDKGNFLPDRKMISLLYRHARLAKALQLSVENFIQMLNFNFPASSSVVNTLRQIRELKDFRDWQKTTSFKISDLAYILSGEKNGQRIDQSPLDFAFSQLEFKNTSFDYLKNNPAIMGIADLDHLNLIDLKALVIYKKLITLRDEVEPLVQTILSALLVPINEISEISEEVKGNLADLWQQDSTLIDSLLECLKSSDAPIAKLAEFWKRLRLCQTLGINGFSLLKLIDDEKFEKLNEARDVALGAFSSKYADEKVRLEKLEPYQDEVNVIKRDALCDYIIANAKEMKFKDLSDIYAYFLLDVEMDGCFRTSRLVCGISSLQLYVHRCLINLEQSDPALSPSITPGLIPANEWEWRKNYRVWEANRKVFLYPENYLEPDLRDNKTSIFKELEDELLQQKITQEAAEAAYKKYVSQFAELAHLRIAGSYYHTETKIYYFFGRTQQDPPQYYYRKWIDNKIWTPWEKIELGINADRVTAIIHMGKLYVFWVEVVARKVINVTGGAMDDLGNEHTVNVSYSYLNENGKWIPAQKLLLKNFAPSSLPDDSYIRPCYPQAFLDKIYLLYKFDNTDSILAILDLFPNQIKILTSYNYLDQLKKPASTPRLRLGASQDNPDAIGLYRYGTGTRRNYLESDEDSVDRVSIGYWSPVDLASGKFSNEEFQPVLFLVANQPGSYIFKLGSQQYLIRQADKADIDPMHSGVFSVSTRTTHRINTILADELGEILFSEGLVRLLSLETQGRLKEHTIENIFIFPPELLGPYDNTDHIDFKGAYGDYYRELFLHIPFLIANHLNANQKFKEAKWWYERIFDPTSSETPNEHNPNDRNWRYIEFRGLAIEKMKEILTDAAALEQYKQNPFNPHAIARLRLNAYQKAIVMKYIDNLLDWGDDLFAQDTMESINEATMLYILAADLLGKRPAKLGECKTANDEGLTYKQLSLSLDASSDIFIAVENWNLSNKVEAVVGQYQQAMLLNTELPLTSSMAKEPAGNIQTFSKASADISISGMINIQPRPASYDATLNEKARYSKVINDWGQSIVRLVNPYPELTLTRQSTLAFCVPPNETLLQYWDRVEDRLFKIRHCMNLSGVRRQLALFQPPIDPMALIKAKAAGLSLEQILRQPVSLPPYRFSYLIEKAKQFTQTVQSFGSALLSALEKKDVEELTLLRSVHERSILRLTREVKKQQIQEAQKQYQAIVDTQTNIQRRITYYSDLIAIGLTSWEHVQAGFKHTATGFRYLESPMHIAAFISALIPNSGSPFAMTYGGHQLHSSMEAWANWFQTMASIANEISSLAGLEASFQRREQEWRQQLQSAQQELRQVEQQRLAAEIRELIVEKDLEIHETNMEQADELNEFYKNKFTRLGLYNYLSTILSCLYREAYIMALGMADMAELAYKFEHDDDTTNYIAGDNWQLDQAGLLAGERLLLQLQQMEKAYIERHSRDYEITQSFSLAFLNPKALLDLKLSADCTFEIPEIVFDLSYPGHYKRMIKSVRMTIPCVAGPYANVSAKLTLKDSWLRKSNKLTIDPLDEVDDECGIAKGTSISTSSAQNDSGVFELIFRDERYLPFEGAGAISEWELQLPKNFRTFDYNTISDVIIHINYTARDNGEFRTRVEDNIRDSLLHLASIEGLYRLFSLKHEFPNAFYQLMNPSPGSIQSTSFDVTRQHFPYFLAEEAGNLQMVEATVYLKPKEKVVSNADITINGVSRNSEGIFSLSGSPLITWTIQTDGLNKDELDDILILLKYKI